MSWKKGDWLPVPTEAIKNIGNAKVQHVTDLKISVDGQEVQVAYRDAKPDNPKFAVLLLHGMKFKSQTWEDKPLFTLQVLCNLGYRAVAIDLPGFGDSPKPSSDVNPANYLEAVIAKLGLDAPVIVSPSMSGYFSIPFVFKDPAKVQERCRGFVPVAPVQTEAYTKAQYQALPVPSLVIHGEKDQIPHAPASLENLSNLQNNVVDIFEGCGHVCYMELPDRFHSHLHTFLSSL